MPIHKVRYLQRGRMSLGCKGDYRGSEVRTETDSALTSSFGGLSDPHRQSS